MTHKRKVPYTKRTLIPWAAHALSHGAISTCRLSVENGAYFEERARAGKNMIFTSWHSRLVALPYYYYYRYGFTNLSIMVSKSEDGEMFKGLLERYKIHTVRGSTSRGGTSALKTMIREARAGRDTAISLDGSKGPRYRAQMGVLLLAQVTGLPIVPLTFDATWRVKMNTWDKLIVPLPFGRIYGVFADPLFIPREEKDLEPYRVQLEHTMHEICTHAASCAGHTYNPAE